MAKDSSKNKSLAKAKKRARTAKGRFKADNPKTPNVNEAYENKSILTKDTHAHSKRKKIPLH